MERHCLSLTSHVAPFPPQSRYERLTDLVRLLALFHELTTSNVRLSFLGVQSPKVDPTLCGTCQYGKAAQQSCNGKRTKRKLLVSSDRGSTRGHRGETRGSRWGCPPPSVAPRAPRMGPRVISSSSMHLRGDDCRSNYETEVFELISTTL
jgi:hypothetical protein